MSPDNFRDFCVSIIYFGFFLVIYFNLFKWFHNIIGRKKNLLNEKKIDVKNFVCENIYTNFIIFLHSFPIILILLFISDFKFQLSLLFAFLGLFIVLINLMLIGYLISILSAIYKDVKKIVENIVYAFFFATPIIWSENMVSAKIQKILIFNPFYHFLVLFRNPLMNDFDEKFYQSFFICLLIMLIIFFINLKINKHLENKTILYL